MQSLTPCGGDEGLPALRREDHMVVQRGESAGQAEAWVGWTALACLRHAPLGNGFCDTFTRGHATPGYLL